MKSDLTSEEKRELIETAQELYRKFLDIRKEEDLFANEIDYHTLKEGCRDMSMLIHYIAKYKYRVPDESNKVFSCIFRYNGKSDSHFFNKIYNEIVDSTIMQFDNFSPYDNHDECYTELEKEKVSYECVKKEIDCFELREYARGKLNKKYLEDNQEKSNSQEYGQLSIIDRFIFRMNSMIKSH